MTLLRWRPTLDPLLVASVAFALRVAHAAFLSRTPFFEGPIIDSQTYWVVAEHAASTGDFGGAFYQPPLYPAFLALLFRAGLNSAWAVEIVQSALGSATAALMVLIGRRLASKGHSARHVGLAVGFTTALYGPLVLFDLELLPPSLVHLLLIGALVLALRPGPVGPKDAAIGLLSGTAITGWPLSFALLPALLALRARRLSKGRPRALGIGLALAFSLPPITLTARHNAAHDGAGILVSYNTGINLWLGNNPSWRDTWRARPGARFEPELERPDREGVTKPGPRSAYFVRMVRRDVAERPLPALGRTLEKFYYVWHGREIRRNQDMELLREASPLLRALVWEAGVFFPFGLLAPLALLSLWRRRREPDISILAFTALFYAVVVAAFFVASRYRLPMVLLLIPVAVDQVFHLVSAGGATGRSLAILATGLVALNLPNDFTRTFAADEAERGILTAQSLRNQGKLERADEISEALALRFPDDANVQMLRAEMLVAAGRCDSALRHLERTIELTPRAATPRVVLGDCYDALGNAPAAERAFATALSLHPYHPVALKRAGIMYARYGRVIEARSVRGASSIVAMTIRR